MSARDRLRLLLQQWSERVKEQQAETNDQNIWDKKTADLNSPKSAASHMSKVTGLQGLNAARANLNVTSVQSGNPSAAYTMEELMRKIRRVERLTENMASGKFEVVSGGGQTRKHAAERSINMILEGTVDGSLMQSLDRRA